MWEPHPLHKLMMVLRLAAWGRLDDLMNWEVAPLAMATWCVCVWFFVTEGEWKSRR